MQLIPVIDLMGGQVVHAKQGRRDAYRPIQTPLCQGASPPAVIDGLLGLWPFTTLYVADLDALAGRGHHRELLLRLQADYPGMQFWLDQGWAGPVGQAVPVIGSESLGGRQITLLPELRKKFILSLDFLGERLLGEQSLLNDESLWPKTAIVMSLSRVGAGEGPDFPRLKELRKQHPGKTLIAAGGVRHTEDLRRLEDLGVGGVLLASALHSGAISREDLQEFF